MTKSPIDHALDLFVFAPLGLALSARDSLPELIDKGRQRFTGQVTTARLVGQMAVSQGQREAEKMMTQAAQRLAELGLIPDGRRTPDPSDPEPSPAVDDAVTPGAPAAGPAPTVPVDELAIPGYDALSAPQVVQRLDGLSLEELEAVRAYEAATRHRKTILSRIAQLQSAAASS